jgi:hypothetical protein
MIRTTGRKLAKIEVVVKTVATAKKVRGIAQRGSLLYYRGQGFKDLHLMSEHIAHVDQSNS